MVFLLHSYDAACDDNRASSKSGQLGLRGFKFPALFRENHPFNRTITSPVYHSSIALEAYRKK
jgi:hypothetical protein